MKVFGCAIAAWLFLGMSIAHASGFNAPVCAEQLGQFENAIAHVEAGDEQAEARLPVLLSQLKLDCPPTTADLAEKRAKAQALRLCDKERAILAVALLAEDLTAAERSLPRFHYCTDKLAADAAAKVAALKKLKDAAEQGAPGDPQHEHCLRMFREIRDATDEGKSEYVSKLLEDVPFQYGSCTGSEFYFAAKEYVAHPLTKPYRSFSPCPAGSVLIQRPTSQDGNDTDQWCERVAPEAKGIRHGASVHIDNDRNETSHTYYVNGKEHGIRFKRPPESKLGLWRQTAECRGKKVLEPDGVIVDGQLSEMQFLHGADALRAAAANAATRKEFVGRIEALKTQLLREDAVPPNDAGWTLLGAMTKCAVQGVPGASQLLIDLAPVFGWVRAEIEQTLIDHIRTLEPHVASKELSSQPASFRGANQKLFDILGFRVDAEKRYASAIDASAASLCKRFTLPDDTPNFGAVLLDLVQTQKRRAVALDDAIERDASRLPQTKRLTYTTSAHAVVRLLVEKRMDRMCPQTKKPDGTYP